MQKSSGFRCSDTELLLFSTRMYYIEHLHMTFAHRHGDTCCPSLSVFLLSFLSTHLLLFMFKGCTSLVWLRKSCFTGAKYFEEYNGLHGCLGCILLLNWFE